MRYERPPIDETQQIPVAGGILHSNSQLNADELQARWAEAYGKGMGQPMIITGTSVQHCLCPDLLRLSDIGVADGWRGHTVRGFFRLLRWVTGV